MEVGALRCCRGVELVVEFFLCGNRLIQRNPRTFVDACMFFFFLHGEVLDVLVTCGFFDHVDLLVLRIQSLEPCEVRVSGM